MTVWINTMPHSGLSLHQVAATVPGACNAIASQSILPTTKQQVRVARNSADSVRIGCNQSSVIDAEPAADTSCWRVDPTLLPGWQSVTAEGAQGPRKFGDNVQDVERSEGNSLGSDEASTTSRSCRDKRRSFYSRPDMVRWRLVVEGVQTSIHDEGQLSQVILFLESLGLDSSKMMVKYPLLCTCSVENIQAVVRFLQSIKLRRKDVVKILNNNPFLLAHNVEENFLPVVVFLLTEVGLPENHVGKVVNRCARLLTASVETQLRPALQFLQGLGFINMSVVVSNNSTLLASSIENRLIPKMEFLISLGLSKEQAVEALIRFPAIFNYSIEKNLQPKVRYLVEDMNCGLDDLRAFPQFFGYSLDCRIRPRHQFLKTRNLCLPLAELLKPTDEVFYARFQHEKLMPQKEPSCQRSWELRRGRGTWMRALFFGTFEAVSGFGGLQGEG